MRIIKKPKNLGAVSPADLQKLAQLRKMQAVALWLLIGMAVIFAVSFALQEKIPAFGYVRAASEGGMVGAIADWFAVTALFRHPLGIKIPHTNLIARKKDDIGEGLGSFIEENFLADEVVHDKLSTISGARHAGEWLSNRENAASISNIVAEVGIALLTVVDDKDVQELIEAVVRKHVINPEWSANLGRALENVLDGGHQEAAVDLVVEHVAKWLASNPESFERLVTSRMPNWVPGFANRLLDRKMHSEALKFATALLDDTEHPLRHTINSMLSDFAHDLQVNPQLRKKVENFKHELFNSPRVRALAEYAWGSAREAFDGMLRDPQSELCTRITSALQDAGLKLADDSTLQYKVDVWVMNAVEHLVHTYRHDLASIVTDTVKDWDASEAAEKIELQVGKDLQFIRINGTIVGSLAGLTIFTVATLAKGFFG